MSERRLPVVFLPHGGGPWPFVPMGLDPRDVLSLSGYLASVGRQFSPKAILVISAHWEAAVPTVMTAAKPPMFYDYYGFPAASYQLQWPAPGAPAVAERARAALAAAGFASAVDAARGFDHGTFIPLMLAWPRADVPTLQISLLSSLDPVEHLRLGEALAPLRDEGVLIVGSGMSFHNLRAFRDPRAGPVSDVFDAWLGEAAVAEPNERRRRLSAWAQSPAARACHPREEHLLPLMVVAGAAGADAGRVAWRDRFMGVALSAFHYGESAA